MKISLGGKKRKPVVAALLNVNPRKKGFVKTIKKKGYKLSVYHRNPPHRGYVVNVTKEGYKRK